jgi:hypothetical protein
MLLVAVSAPLTSLTARNGSRMLPRVIEGRTVIYFSMCDTHVVLMPPWNTGASNLRFMPALARITGSGRSSPRSAVLSLAISLGHERGQLRPRAPALTGCSEDKLALTKILEIGDFDLLVPRDADRDHAGSALFVSSCAEQRPPRGYSRRPEGWSRRANDRIVCAGRSRCRS